MRLLSIVSKHVGGNIVAYLALVVAMSGTAYAAATIGSGDVIDNSLRSVDLKDGNVKQVDLKPAQPWREVGAVGQPAFQGTTVISGFPATWVNETFGGVHETAGFYRDPYGRVHLKGTVCLSVDGSGGGCFQQGGQTPGDLTIFTLPSGYRPAHKVVFSAMSSDGPIRVDVRASGEVVTDRNTKTWMALDAISFRCAPAGLGGCP